MRIDIITLFPEVIEPFFGVLPYKRALKKDIADIKVWNLRNYALDSYGTVDGKPYGGGKGMILMIEPIYNALEEIKKDSGNKYENERVVLLSPRGKIHDQKKVKELATCDHMVLICGRYEGVDHRVAEFLATDVISIGNYVLSGGEIPALAVMESVLRITPGVLEKDAVQKESFENGHVEHPQYTRPEDFKGWSVPKVLLSGHHKNIEKWKSNNSTKISS